MKLKGLVSRTRKSVKTIRSETSAQSPDDHQELRFGLFDIQGRAQLVSDEGIDLVAVHGLGGHRTQTWQHPATKACWLRDFLPADIPNARIMTYGYNSTVAFSRSVVGIEEFARDLLERLRMVRNVCDIPHRPIIFVCHSMGGLVVKKALIIAQERSSVYGDLLESTSGIAFFATPHRGSALAGPAELASRLLRATQLGSGTNDKLVSCLRRDAKILWNISTQFVDRATRLQIKTFYETKPMLILNSLIVDKNSAVLHHPNEVAMPLGADHRTICQFQSRDCPNYLVVRAAIQDLCTTSLQARKKSGAKSELSLDLIPKFHKSDYEGYKNAVELPVRGTCAWFLTEPKYLEWLHTAKSSLLWISGDPGCGKTTLARFLVENAAGQLPTKDGKVKICHFFFDEKLKTQSHGASLLLALIHQLLKANPELALLVQKHLALNDPQLAMCLPNLCEIIKSIVSERGAPNIVCVVDALDECEASSMIQVIKWLSSLISDKNEDPDPKPWLKVAFTSRHYQSINDLMRTVPYVLRCSLGDYTEQTSRDIETFIKSRSAGMQDIVGCSDDAWSRIEVRLMERSDGNFLWVSLVLDILESDADSSEEAYERVFIGLPEELDGVYERILQRSRHPEALLRVLSVIAASRRALTLSEINSALAVGIQDTSWDEVERRLQFDMARRLYGVCGPFIRISNDTVSFVHQTAKEFLVRPPTIPPLITTAGSTWVYKHCLAASQVNRLLAEICVVSLAISDNHEDRSRLDLFDYAAKHWGAHCRLGEISEHDELLFAKIQRLCDTSAAGFRSWFQLYWDTIATVPEFPDDLTSLMVASHLGLRGVMRFLLGSATTSVNTQDSEGWAATHWAVWNGHGDAVDEEWMGILLQPGAALDLQDKRGMTALHWAAADGQEVAVKLLLEAGAQVDILDCQGMTPLAIAVENEFLGTVELLLDHGADENAAGEHEDSYASFDKKMETFWNYSNRF